ncbi:conserved hypothetical protein [Talaromyces stipitatus ATCC 10500]|uniref:Uncharacterized protein n=1 Tax=Talaromyces stipitatus (strain ATCC 10500 / CBS 375.48 / QM 6759 / NRRL 1006) TaxID=441959 RepID=B8M220_TALSN|nr:uncharacterized protein TSTA_087170 [Talaromyces stipitatus ATCC 10500]EED21484.1 conserved hypothetical protein [Talaromyces stipitatus ATCC 10500]
MRYLTILSALYFTLLYSLPTRALTGGKAWVNFYKDCPNEILEIEEVTIIVSSPKQSAGNRAQSPSSPSASHSIGASSSSSVSIIPSSSAIPSASASSIKLLSASTSSSSVLSPKSKFRSALAARNTEKSTIRSPFVNITQGQCEPVPIVTERHIDSSSVSVGTELLTVTPFQECNITVHEVPGCIDDPLLVAPVKNRKAESTCTPRNFGAFNDVWVRLDCSEIGTALNKFDTAQDSASKTRPLQRVF